jgi:hypothetical protein
MRLFPKMADLVYVGAQGQNMPNFLRSINNPDFYGKIVTLVGRSRYRGGKTKTLQICYNQWQINGVRLD